MTTTDEDWGRARAAAARAVEALRLGAEGLPATGGFETLVEGFDVDHPAWPTGRVELRLGATPRLTATGTEPTDARHVDVCVLTPGGGSETKRAILRGSTAEIVEGLRSLEVPRQVVALMRELAEHQRRLELP
jgi:hypothetical protein